MNLETLNRIVGDDAALRRRQMLQPVGGKGDKIFPPTYPGEGQNAPPRHVYERRRVNGGDIWCVLVDSVQSQANRLEESLLTAITDGVKIPHVVVDFSGAKLDGITKITSLDAPHRVYDAIMRDSLHDGTPFMESEIGQRLAKAKPDDASVLLEVSPTALLFGAWHSTGEGGGLGAKFARCLTSEIVGIGVPIELKEARSRSSYFIQVGDRTVSVEPVTSGQRTGSRIDPLGVLKGVKIYQAAENERDWTAFKDKAAKIKGEPVLYKGRKSSGKAGTAAKINHGNIPPDTQPLGVTCDHLEHSFVLSFAALRRLRFGDGAKDAAGHSLLAALGLVALAEQDSRGYALRSRCDLVCEGKAPLDLVHPDGATEPIEIDRKTARDLYNATFESARKAGFALAEKPLVLKPQDKLVEIVRESQKLALAAEGGDENGAGANESDA